MTSSTNQHESTPDGRDEGPSSLDRMENLNISTHLTGQEKSCTKNQFIPSSDGTPVSKLPNELLSYIFTVGSEAEKRKSGYDDDDGEEEEQEDEDVLSEQDPRLPFQVLVSHVCRQWRTVATETLTLWTYLNFQEGPPFNKSRAWLERSEECPLVIELDYAVDLDGSSRISPADLPVVRDIILPHSARWRAFDLIVYSNEFEFMNDMLSTLDWIPEAPELRTLSLRYKLWRDFEAYIHFIPVPTDLFFAPFSGRAPKLRLVTLWAVYVDWKTCDFLQGLEVLELGYHAKVVRPPYEVFSRILRESPDLHTLKLSASGPAGEEGNWPTDVIELPSVRRFSLAIVPLSYASALLKRLVFPNLSVLSLEIYPEDCTAFINQMARPPPNQRHSVYQNLVELRLSGTHCSDTALATLYAALPNLVTLNINCYHLPHRFFEYLFTMVDFEDPDGFYLPKLTTLTTYGISVQRMHILVTIRPTIQHVQMDSKTDVDKESEGWLRAHTESFEFFDDSDDEEWTTGMGR